MRSDKRKEMQERQSKLVKIHDTPVNEVVADAVLKKIDDLTPSCSRLFPTISRMLAALRSDIEEHGIEGKGQMIALVFEWHNDMARLHEVDPEAL